MLKVEEIMLCRTGIVTNTLSRITEITLVTKLTQLDLTQLDLPKFSRSLYSVRTYQIAAAIKVAVVIGISAGYCVS